MYSQETGSVSAAPEPTLMSVIRTAIAANHGWLPFDRYMAMALYEPGLGYYARGDRQFGALPSSGSDFVTAPELTPLFGHALARQVRQALAAGDLNDVWEFGAGSGAMAASLLDALGERVTRYRIVEVSAALRARQRERLAGHGARVEWLDRLPDAIEGVVVGNEVLDAMPVTLLHHDGQRWLERGVAIAGDGLAFADRPTRLAPPEVARYAAGATVEIHPQADAFVATLAERMTRGAAFFIDYGFPEAEYYHPQRHAGTLMCHRAHRADTDPLADVGAKDITAHVDFSAIALAGQQAGFDVLGYTTQAHFLINCGLLDLAFDVREQAAAQKLLGEHEMGELFKVIGFAKNLPASFTTAPIGFAAGDRTHTL
ncbi:MAG: SAM-dependent methyltransferase [Proteobacteria bacterium]|nr:SAM-dependent methyltransferase [Pseudomonadota bacterium]